MRYIKKTLQISLFMIAFLTMQSCYTTQLVDRYVSVINDLNDKYIGKTKEIL